MLVPIKVWSITINSTIIETYPEPLPDMHYNKELGAIILSMPASLILCPRTYGTSLLQIDVSFLLLAGTHADAVENGFCCSMNTPVMSSPQQVTWNTKFKMSNTHLYGTYMNLSASSDDTNISS